MSDTSPLLKYREPGIGIPQHAAWVKRVERGTTLSTLFLLLILMPALYGIGAINIIVLNQLGRFLCFAIVALGIDLIWGYCGILSLCQAMFFCFGGYAIGMHMALHGPLDGDGIPRCLYVVTSVVEGFQLPWFWKPFQTLPAAIILAMFLPGLAAFIFGYFAFRSRVRGVYFSIITQATTLAVCLVFRRNETRLCGTNGLTNFVTLAGFDLSKPSTKLSLYFITVLTLILVYFLCRYVVKTRLGRLLVAVRDNESRLRFAGYQPVTIKAFAFTLAAMIAGIGGMLYSPQNGIITPYKMEPEVSIFMVVWVAVGGRGTLTGAVLGAVLINYVESILTSQFPSVWPFFEGGLFIAVVLLFPDGIVGAWQKFTRGQRQIASALLDSPSLAAPDFSQPTAGDIAAEGAQ
jgi:urea transport system permease protein